MAEPYLVVFVADPATDAHAEELRGLAHAAAQLHAWEGPEPRFFDLVPDGGDERTVGVALRVTELADADRHAVVSLVHGCAAAGERLGVRLEVQLAERRLGVLSDGEADAAVLDALREDLGLDVA
jgi:hypothetical protein